MTKEQEAAAGMEVARKAMLARADGDQAAELAAINTATESEAKWAAAYLLECLWAQTLVNQKGRALKAAGHLRRQAETIVNQNIVETQIELIVQAEERGDHNG